jgi:hypothetical protein
MTDAERGRLDTVVLLHHGSADTSTCEAIRYTLDSAGPLSKENSKWNALSFRHSFHGVLRIHKEPVADALGSSAIRSELGRNYCGCICHRGVVPGIVGAGRRNRPVVRWSPWASGASNASSSRLGFAILGLILNQSCVRTWWDILPAGCALRWLDLHTDEVHFRDTAHGFLV